MELLVCGRELPESFALLQVAPSSHAALSRGDLPWMTEETPLAGIR